MAFDQNLATRVENYLIDRGFIEEKPMFGGLGFLLNGNMACGVNKDDLSIRVQVIRANNEDHIWGKEYNREWKDIHTIQDDIAKKVAEELSIV